jgi:hypothetical protein
LRTEAGGVGERYVSNWDKLVCAGNVILEEAELPAMATADRPDAAATA